jgi:hypothetical protein
VVPVAVVVQPGRLVAMDWSFSRIDARVFVAQGVKLALRYITGSKGDPGKVLTVAERDRIFAAGMAILLNFEESSTAAFKGGDQGRVHGGEAKAKATALGYPTDLPIIVSVDTDITAGTLRTAEDYVRSFAAACLPYPIGVYGDTDIIGAVKDISQLNWLPNASAWSDKNSTARSLVHIRQHGTKTENGLAWDPDDVEKPVKAWFVGSTFDQPPTTLRDPPTKEDDMAALPTTAVLITIPGFANTFLVGAGPAFHVDPVLFDHYHNKLGIPLLQVTAHEQLITTLIHQSGVDLLGSRGVHT